MKNANPAARYCCDPVIGDLERGVFVRRGIPQLIRERMLRSPTPSRPINSSSAIWRGRGTATMADLAAALDAVHACGPRVVFVTSLAVDDTPPDTLDLVVSDASGAGGQVRPLRLPIVGNGAGDAVAALFFAHHLRARSAAEAMALAASAMYYVLSRTAEAGADEMLLVEAQDEFVAPSRMFVPQRIQGEFHATKFRDARRVRSTGGLLATCSLWCWISTDLDAAAMQAIAREFNHPETVFVFPPAEPAHRARSHLHACASCRSPATRRWARRCCSRCARPPPAARSCWRRASAVRCVLEASAGAAGCVRFAIPQLPTEFGAAPDNATIAAALGIAAAGKLVSTVFSPRAGRPATSSPSCRSPALP